MSVFVQHHALARMAASWLDHQQERSRSRRRFCVLSDERLRLHCRGWRVVAPVSRADDDAAGSAHASVAVCTGQYCAEHAVQRRQSMLSSAAQKESVCAAHTSGNRVSLVSKRVCTGLSAAVRVRRPHSCAVSAMPATQQRRSRARPRQRLHAAAAKKGQLIRPTSRQRLAHAHAARTRLKRSYTPVQAACNAALAPPARTRHLRCKQSLRAPFAFSATRRPRAPPPPCAPPCTPSCARASAPPGAPCCNTRPSCTRRTA